MKYTLSVGFLLIWITLSAQYQTKLKGDIKNQNDAILVLTQSHEDWRYNGIEIPVNLKGQFEYTLDHEFIEEYSLAFKSELEHGAWIPITFFPQGGTIDFELYPSIEFENNKIQGSDLLIRKIEFQNSYAKEFSLVENEIYDKLFQSEEQSDQWNSAKVRLDSLNAVALEFQYQYFLNDTTILGLNEYVNILRDADQLFKEESVFEKYQEYYTQHEINHPLIERAINLYTALRSAKIGQEYIDITLQHNEEKTVNLSDKIGDNEFTLLDMWAPWCGPCIKKSMNIKEIYTELRSNMNVVSVVGGINNIDDGLRAINKYDYPWISYVEISDQNKIWEKYGISNGGGAQFLIKNTGKIIAINPTLDEIMKFIVDR